MSSVKYPFILVVRRRISKNISMICALFIHNIWNLLSIEQPSSIRALSCPDMMFTQTSSLNKFLPNSRPSKVFILFLAHNTPTYFNFNINVVVQFSMINTLKTPYMITLKPPHLLLYFSLKYITPTQFHPALHCISLTYWKPPQQPRRKSLPLKIPL